MKVLHIAKFAQKLILFRFDLSGNLLQYVTRICSNIIQPYVCVYTCVCGAYTHVCIP